jgi:hypothetical protein
VIPDARPPIEYATRTDLEVLRQQIRADLAEQIVHLQRTMITTLVALTAIFGGLVTILKLFG